MLAAATGASAQEEGGGFTKIFTIGSLPMNMRAEGYYNVARPDSEPKWTVGVTIRFLLPK